MVSQKFKGPGLRYELGVAVKTGAIVWLHGPFPAGMYNDCLLFQRCLATFLDLYERVECDDGNGPADPGKAK